MNKKSSIERALDEGQMLFSRQKTIGNKNRLLSLKACGSLVDARQLCVGIIANATARNSGKPGKNDADLAHQLSLSASFIQGISLCETAISEGLYVSASALLKQEMETIAAIREVTGSVRKQFATPNVKSFGKLAVLYGDLNRLAHVSDRNWMQSFVKMDFKSDQSGAPLFPIFDQHLSKLFYGLHVCFLACVTAEIHKILDHLYGEGLLDFEIKMLGQAATILEKYGWLLQPDQETK